MCERVHRSVLTSILQIIDFFVADYRFDDKVQKIVQHAVVVLLHSALLVS